MTDEIEIVNGKASMAWAGSPPWHNMGKRVPADLTPEQMLKAAQLDWSVEKVPAYVVINDEVREIGKSALVRDRDHAILDVVSDDWQPVQNLEAFEFFNEFIAAGHMSMETAGSLQGGQIVWALANIKEGFELFKGDEIAAYLLFTNYHKYGYSTDVRFTPVRVVCWNTIQLALNAKVDRMVKYTHRKQFNPEEVKEILGISHQRLAEYKETAQFLGSKKAKNEDIVEYFKRVFPVSGAAVEKEMSKNASLALSVVKTQPGANYARGTWWQPFNAVTYVTDHLHNGNNADTRLASAWYGYHKKVKNRALELAVEYAEAA